MATVTNTGSTAKKFIKPDYIVVTEFAGTEADNTEAAGASYILEDVIEDTTSISQDDNETNDIECETSDSPIISIVKLGKYQFAAEVGDTQASLLQALMGFKKDGTRVIAPSTYSKKYVKVAIVFNDSDDKKVAFVVPRLQLNSKLTIESLNSNLARIALAGTANDFKIKVGQNTYSTPFYVEEDYKLPVAG